MSKNRKPISISFKKETLDILRQRHQNLSLYIQKLVDDDLDKNSYRPVPKDEARYFAAKAKKAISTGNALYADSRDAMRPTRVKKIVFDSDNANFYVHKTYGLQPFDIVHISISENLGHGRSIKSSLYATADDSGWLDDLFFSAASTAILPIHCWRQRLPLPDDQFQQMHYSGTLLDAANTLRKEGSVRIEVSASSSRVLRDGQSPSQGSVLLSAKTASFPPGTTGEPFSEDTSDDIQNQKDTTDTL